MKQVEDALLRCTPDVMAMALDHLHEMLVKEPHPHNETVAEVWCPQVITHSKLKLNWKKRREKFFKSSHDRYYVRIPLVEEIKVVQISSFHHTPHPPMLMQYIVY